MRSLTFTHTIGAGAFGTVYKADLTTDQGFRRQVAVKIILTDHAEKEMFITRMRDEARLLGLLQGDHILKVLDLMSVNDRDAIIMEYIEGIDLSDSIKAGKLPPLRATMEIAAIVAGTLDRAHAAVHPQSREPLGVVHRDVKPANVMLTASGSLKLLDFGIAQARFAARESQTGQMVLGTLNYMAPDYIISGEVTPAIDVYGLGLTLFELITGQVFGQPTLREDRHNTRLGERLDLIDPAHTELRSLLEQMLHWNPEERPSCTECEKRLILLADEMRGASLRRFAAEVVPALLNAREPQPDRERLLGTTLRLGQVSIPDPGELADTEAEHHSAEESEGHVPSSEPIESDDTDDAPTTIAARKDIARKLSPITAETALTVPPATVPGNDAHIANPEPAPSSSSTTSAILRGILIGGTAGILAVGVLAIVLFYLFPPESLP